jgi:hypothetical protein
LVVAAFELVGDLRQAQKLADAVAKEVRGQSSSRQRAGKTSPVRSGG